MGGSPICVMTERSSMQRTLQVAPVSNWQAKVVVKSSSADLKKQISATTVLLLFVAKKQFPFLGSFQMNLIVVILQLGELWSERGTLRKSDPSYDTCYTSAQTRDTPFFLRDVFTSTKSTFSFFVCHCL